MIRELREKDFKLGRIHGKLNAENKRSEAHIQRTVFLTQRLKINRARENASVIRLFGYEIPVEDYRRGRCIDLMGYDADHNLYLIELKKRESNEKIEKIILQINDYADKVQRILPHIEREFEETFFLSIKFFSVKKMIIAPREFYAGKKHRLTDKSIDYGYYRLQDINKAEPREIINIHLKKR